MAKSSGFPRIRALASQALSLHAFESPDVGEAPFAVVLFETGGRFAGVRGQTGLGSGSGTHQLGRRANDTTVTYVTDTRSTDPVFMATPTRRGDTVRVDVAFSGADDGLALTLTLDERRPVRQSSSGARDE